MAASKNKQVVWYYNFSDQPWSEAPTASLWKRYRDHEIAMIEEAYQERSESVCLDRYRINLKNFIQVRLDDDSKRRSVKRETDTKSNEGVLPPRFYEPLPLQTLQERPSTYAAFDAWCPFLKAWLQSPLGKQVLFDFKVCIEPCALGIIQEAANYDRRSRSDAEYMAGKLRQSSGRSRREVSNLCMVFYTKDTFLYSVLNQALRECDLTKLGTLGPYAYLLSNHARTGKEYCGTVYRGAQLTPAHVEEYEKALGTWKSWPAYTSTSRDRSVAESFGNTLFVIAITGDLPTTPRGFDVSDLSGFPGEAEIIIPPGISFLVLSVNQDPQQNYSVHLKF